MDTSATLPTLLQDAPPRRDAVVCGDQRLSSVEIRDRAAQVAGALNARGIGHGDHVAFQMPTGIDALVMYRACWIAGVVAIALHPTAQARQLTNALDQAEPALLVADADSALHSLPGAVTIDELTGGAVPPPSLQPGDDAVVLFSSGSTGAPKGVIHTHQSLVYKARQSIDVHGLTADDVVLMPAPLAHVSGLLHAVLVPGVVGAKAVLMPKWDAGEALDLIESEHVTWMVGPPTFFLGLMNHPAFTPERTRTLRLISCGGAGVSPSFVTRAREELGAIVKRAYGSTEAPTVTTSANHDPAERMTATDGRAHGDAEVHIANDGEIWVRGPELARGYLDSERNDESFVDGWFRTGDLGSLDDGWLTVTGRIGGRIIRGGENISTSEVEAILESHPAVRQAVALPEPDERLGERVLAVVAADPGFDLAECQRWFMAQGATKFITPERVVTVAALPLLASGKVDRVTVATDAIPS